MNILIANTGIIPVIKYGGTERVIWYLGQELAKMGHKITYLVNEGSYCDFATVIFFDNTKTIAEQIPEEIDIIHFNFIPPASFVKKPYIVTLHGNLNDQRELDINTVFVSGQQAKRFGSVSFVYNGLNWDDYGDPGLGTKRNYFHFLGEAAWRVKNVQGAIDTIKMTKKERLAVLGGSRLNFSMGFRLTLSSRIKFYGKVGGEEKNKLIRSSSGLVFPVKWNEPFGLAIIESLYFGCPIFGTPYGSLPELVKKEVGFLSNKAKELAEAIENRQAFSSKDCHACAIDNFNSKKMSAAYLQKYYTVLNGGTLNVVKPKLKVVQTDKFLEWVS